MTIYVIPLSTFEHWVVFLPKFCCTAWLVALRDGPQTNKLYGKLHLISGCLKMCRTHQLHVCGCRISYRGKINLGGGGVENIIVNLNCQVTMQRRFSDSKLIIMSYFFSGKIFWFPYPNLKARCHKQTSTLSKHPYNAIIQITFAFSYILSQDREIVYAVGSER